MKIDLDYLDYYDNYNKNNLLNIFVLEKHFKANSFCSSLHRMSRQQGN